jgi:hypothetical protein
MEKLTVQQKPEVWFLNLQTIDLQKPHQKVSSQTKKAGLNAEPGH